MFAFIIDLARRWLCPPPEPTPAQVLPTADELAASLAAGPEGVIMVDGVSCYVA